MGNRYWRIAGNFHRLGDVIVTVQGPNWQSALRKAALAIKHLPIMKGKKLTSGSFMLQEVEAPPAGEVASEQLQLPSQQAAPVQQGEGQTPPSTTSEPEKLD